MAYARGRANQPPARGVTQEDGAGFVPTGLPRPRSRPPPVGAACRPPAAASRPSAVVGLSCGAGAGRGGRGCCGGGSAFGRPPPVGRVPRALTPCGRSAARSLCWLAAAGGRAVGLRLGFVSALPPPCLRYLSAFFSSRHNNNVVGPL